MAQGNEHTYIKYDKLPRINGELIEDIYIETLPFPETKFSHYLCCNYFTLQGHSDIKLSKLPKAIQNVFDEYKISSLHFRTSNSGHANPDWTINVTCKSDHSDECIDRSLYMGFNFDEDSVKNPHIIPKKSPLAKALMELTGKDFKVTALPWYHGVEFPSSYIRTEGGLNYPDVKLESWRWCYAMPFVSSDYSSGHPDLRNIRVFSEHLNAHLYLQEVEPQEGDEDLIICNFPQKKGDQFVNIHRWSSTKKEDPNGIIRYKVLKIKEKDNWPITVAAMIGDEIQFKETNAHRYYKLIKMSQL